MSVYEYYISPEDYETAKANGITPRTLTTRIRVLGWDKVRATTQRPKAQERLPELRERAEANGVSAATFYARVRRGWDPETAARTPPIEGAESAQEARRKIPKQYYEMAAKNGISCATFRSRVFQSGWSYERAATEPVWLKGGR